MNPTSFTSLIVTYNSATEVLNLLNDLGVYVTTGDIIVIDNASRDETVPLVQKHFPQVRLIRNSTNVGYARAVNQGFDLCTTENVLLLNPDIRIASSRLFSAMEECLRLSRQVAVAAPLQFKDDEYHRKLNFTWSYSTPMAFRVYASFLVHHHAMVTKPIRVTFLNAGCLFIRKSAFDMVGKLNEKYFMYGEEPDLFLKFKRYGYECYLLPDVDVTHYRERSLRTIPISQRLQIKFQAALNITDALLTGWTRILFDRFTARKSKPIEEN